MALDRKSIFPLQLPSLATQNSPPRGGLRSDCHLQPQAPGLCGSMFRCLGAWSLAVVLLAVAPACQQGPVSRHEKGAATDEPGAAPVEVAKAQAGDPYRRDVDRICNSEAQSGALELEEGARAMHVAQWLGANIESQDGREFLASLSRADPKGKASLLMQESQRLGLGECALAKAWSGPDKKHAVD